MGISSEVIIITGSSGFIGSSLAQRLSRKYKVVGLDRGLPTEPIPGVDYHKVDMSSQKSIEEVLEKIRESHGQVVTSVIHLVAYYNFDGKQSSKYQEITVNGTEFLLTSLRKTFEVGQFIFSSTMLVHEPPKNMIEISEDSPVKAGWAYPQSKVAAEKVISENRGNVPVLNLRIAGVYEDSSHSIPISNHISRVYECQLTSVLFPGNADHGQTFLHLEDLIDAIELAIRKRSQLPSELTLLLAEDEVIPYRELQSLIGRHTHDISWPSIRVPKFFARFGAFMMGKTPLIREPFIKPWMIDYADDHYDVDISKARTLLGWEPKHKLRNTIPMMISSLKEDPVSWYKYNKLALPPVRSLDPITDSERRFYWGAAFFNIFLAIWLISNPFTLGVMSNFEYWNDIIAGVLILLISLLTLLPPFRNLRWANALIGCWLMGVPLIAWSESAAMYSNDTLIGALVLFFAAFTPSSVDRRYEVPHGWSYNPSSWTQRLPIMTLAFLGFLMARYLAAYQLGHIENVWDPFFGDGTARILKSDVSKAFPVSDAGLGAMSYLMDVIAAAIGDRNRWRTMPWMVVLFGLFIIPTGATSITLVMLQPIAVNAWCTLCLITAAIMLIMVPPAIDEVVATVQFLRRSVKAGRPFWQTFWKGAEEVEGPEAAVLPERYPRGSRAGVIGGTLLGSALLFVPEIMDFSGPVATNIYIVAALIVTVSVIAYAQVARLLRLLNLPLGIWLAVSPWVLEGLEGNQKFIVALAGIVLILLSYPRGFVKDHYGTFDPWVHFNAGQLFYWMRKGRHTPAR